MFFKLLLLLLLLDYYVVNLYFIVTFVFIIATNALKEP